MTKIGINKVNHFCMKKHHLTESSKSSNILRVVNDIGGLHATSPSTMYLSLFVRMKEFQKEDLNWQLYEEKALGKIRFVRGTMYVLPKEKVPLAYSAMRRRFSTLSKKYAEYHGISEKEFRRKSKEIMKVLGKNSMSTNEIKRKMSSQLGISQIINIMCDSGQLNRGKPEAGWKSNLHTYQSMGVYFPELDLFSIPEKEARKQVLLDYVTSFGPVSIIDIAWWTGFTKTEIKQILGDLGKEIIEVKISGTSERYLITRSDKSSLRSIKLSSRPVITLLPLLDPYLMGYKIRNRYLDGKYYNYIFDRSGNATSSILVNGTITGVWSYEEKPVSIVKIYLFRKFEEEIKSEIRNNAKSIGEFIAEGNVRVKESKKMIPLTERTAGSFMAPLKDSL
jgi:hypothetical protein